MNVNLKKLAVTAAMAGAVGGMSAIGVGVGAAHADQKIPVPPVPVPNIPDVNVAPVNVPAVNVPDVDVPAVNLPPVNVPAVNVPDFDVPQVNVSDIDVPRVNLPDVDIPEVNFPQDIGWSEFVNMPPGHIGQILGVPPGQLKNYKFIRVPGVDEPRQVENPFFGKPPGHWGDIEVPEWWRGQHS